MDVDIKGYCDPRFEAVRDAFAKNFAVDDEAGASYCAYLDGERVVDIWGGFTDAAKTRPWEADTLVNVWSTTKALTATCAHMLVDRGQLDLDAPVARYWPEFAPAGKERLPVRWLLCHKAGLAGISEPLPTEALYDWDRMCAALARQAPLWEPGTAAGYHALTFGYLVGEVVRRIDGRSLGRFFHEEIARPLGVDAWIGLPATEDGRAAEMVTAKFVPSVALPPRDDSSPQAAFRRALATPPVNQRLPNERAWRAAEIPAANGHGNAASIARVMAALARGGELDGVRLLSEKAIEGAIVEQFYGKDLMLGPMRWALGYMLTSEEIPLSPNARAFGHGGWGGSLGLADLDARLGVAYAMNRLSDGTTGDNRFGRLIRATYAAL